MADPINQPIHVDTRYTYRLMLADGRPALGVIGGGHTQPFTPQEIDQIAAHAVRCWNAFAPGNQSAPPAVPQPLTNQQLLEIIDGIVRPVAFNRGIAIGLGLKVARAIERAHGIGITRGDPQP